MNNLEYNLEVNIAALKLKNPVMPASGTFGYGEECSNFVDLNKIGAIVPKSITLKEREGNPQPRIYEAIGGIINSIGLENIGVDRFISEKLPFYNQFATPVIVSIAGETLEEYIRLTERLNEANKEGLPVHGIEANLSCPNVKKGKRFSEDPKGTYELIKALKSITKTTDLSIWAKFSPYSFDSVKAACDAGADAVVLINTLPAFGIYKRKIKPGEREYIIGGLSGPCIKPIGLYNVREASEIVDVPIIGVGGITNTDDAIEYLRCGASAIQVGTANFINFGVMLSIIKGLKNYMKEHKIKDINDLIGKLV